MEEVEEDKWLTMSTPDDVVVQLKANMLVLMYNSFLKSVESTDGSNDIMELVQKVEKVEHLSTYGISHGLGKGVTILKCSVDFRTNDLTFDNRFTGSPTGIFLNLDWAIDYCIQRFKGSPPPAEVNT